MESWKTQLTAFGKDFGEVSVRRGIFQRDSLSPLLFVIAMLPLSNVLNESEAGYQLSKEEGKITYLLTCTYCLGVQRVTLLWIWN